MDFNARLSALRDWHERTTDALPAEDLLLAAFIGPVARARLKDFVWSSTTLSARWQEISDSMSDSADPARRGVVPPPMDPPPVDAPRRPPYLPPIEEESEALNPPPGPETLVTQEAADPQTPSTLRERLLLAWAGHHTSRGDVTGLGKDFLRSLAQSVATSAPDVMSFVTAKGGSISPTLAEEIASVMAPQSPDQETTPGPESPAIPPTTWMRDTGGFEPFNLDNIVDAHLVRGRVSVATADGHLQLSWPAQTGEGVHLYRVVSSDDSYPLISPEFGDLVGATTETQGVCEIVPRNGATYFGVWCHSGTDLSDARSNQPVPLAKGYVLWPPTRLDVKVTSNNEVTGKFEAPEGATVEISRSLPGQNPDTYDLARLLDPSVVRINGFVDREPPLGVRLTYSARTRVHVDGRADTSHPLHATVTVTPDPWCPTLEVQDNPRRPGTYDVSWVTPPFGKIRVFLTDVRPPNGLGERTRTREVVEGRGLDDRVELAYPTVQQGDRTTIEAVSMNHSWVRGFFVAIHEVSDECIGVGPVETRVRVQQPTDVSIVERVDSQIVILRWPEGATSIEVYQGPRGGDVLDLQHASPLANITRSEYTATGGIALSSPLPPIGCSVHVYGVVSEKGSPHRSAGVVVDYPGISVVHYRCSPVAADGQPAPDPGSVAGYNIELYTRSALPELPVILLAHPTRLPLSPQERDARVLYSGPVIPTPDQVAVITRLPAGPHEAYVRLFHGGTIGAAAAVAIIEPHVMRLRLA